MFCFNCGKPLNNDFKFCPYCGTNIITGDTSSAHSNSNSGFDIRDGVLVKYTGRASHVIVPDGVKMIGKNAFCEDHEGKENKYVKKITLPDSVVEIESYAFNNCSCLTEIHLPQGLTEIQPYTFYRCSKLDTVHIPSSVKVIQHDAFVIYTDYGGYASSCPLEKTVIPESVIEMGASRYCVGETRGDDGHSIYSWYFGGLRFPTKCKLNRKYQEFSSRQSAGLCAFCGGKFSIFTGKCKRCGRGS